MTMGPVVVGLRMHVSPVVVLISVTVEPAGAAEMEKVIRGKALALPFVDIEKAEGEDTEIFCSLTE